MKKSITILSTAMLALLGFGTVTIMSCGKDSTTCQIGYEGKDCKTLSRDKFIGSWEGTDNCSQSGNVAYTMTINESSTSKVNVLITNPGGFGGSIQVTGSITAPNKVSLTNVNVGSNVNVNGTLIVNGNSLTTDYTASDNSGASESCTGSFTKR